MTHQIHLRIPEATEKIKVKRERLKKVKDLGAQLNHFKEINRIK